jgi:hypothetical protein
LTKEDGNNFCCFLREIFGDGLSINEQIYEHIHFNNPAGESILYGAWDGEKLVGTNVLDWCNFFMNGKPIHVTHSHSAATHPDYRLCLFESDKKITNIYSHLNHLCSVEAQKLDILLTYGFPNQYALKPAIKYAHYFDIGTLPILLDIFRCREIVSMKRPTWSQNYCTFLTFLPQLVLSLRNRYYSSFSSNVQVQHVHEINEEWDHFANEISKHYSIIQLRDSKYLRWRFWENPARKYHILEARRSGKLEGYLVYIVNPWPERENNKIMCGYIVDFLVPPTSNGNETLRNLLYQARIDFINQKAVIATSICNIPSRFLKVFSRSGFWKAASLLAPRPVHFIIQKHFLETKYFHDTNKIVDNLESWYLTIGDNDII